MMQFEHMEELGIVFDSIHNGVMIIDDKGKIVVCNKAAATMMGKERDEVLGGFIGDVIPTAWDDVSRLLDTGLPQIGKKISRGTYTIVANRTAIFQNQRIVGAVSVFQDISDFERIAEQLETYRQVNLKLDAIINSSFDGLWICDNEGRVSQINKASERINGITAEQVVGERMDTLIRQGLIDRSVTLEVLKTRTGVTMIQNLKNGKQILVTGNPVFEDSGEISLVVVNERDITSLIRLRNELEESRALASKFRSELSLREKQSSLLRDVIANSDVMQKVLNRSLKVAEVDSTVLLQGETGVGKGFFAKLIHQASHRNNGPFIRVDCGAIPDGLIESELFGYEKGAFTGAGDRGKPGLLELAAGGTLFLDEIGDLPFTVQVKLLRFLEENSVMRVGGTRLREIDARVIAATHRDLEAMAKKGEFRKDLFFRLNVVPVYIPPLRERGEDIPSLIDFFLKRFNAKHSKNKGIQPRVIDSLCQYPYSGNVREMSNLMEQLVVLSQDDIIRMEDLPDHVRQPLADAEDWLESGTSDLSHAVEQVEKTLIMRALKTCGTQRKAAYLLGINQSTLARKVKRYGIGS